MVNENMEKRNEKTWKKEMKKLGKKIKKRINPLFLFYSPFIKKYLKTQE